MYLYNDDIVKISRLLLLLKDSILSLLGGHSIKIHTYRVNLMFTEWIMTVCRAVKLTESCFIENLGKKINH